MMIKKLIIFILSTFLGYFIGVGIGNLIKSIAPEYFNIDPGLLTIWFSNKPSMSSQMLGYLIYVITSIVMFTFSSMLGVTFGVQADD